jgi:hypothetical protein
LPRGRQAYLHYHLHLRPFLPFVAYTLSTLHRSHWFPHNLPTIPDYHMVSTSPPMDVLALLVRDPRCRHLTLRAVGCLPFGCLLVGVAGLPLPCCALLGSLTLTPHLLYHLRSIYPAAARFRIAFFCCCLTGRWCLVAALFVYCTLRVFCTCVLRTPSHFLRLLLPLPPPGCAGRMTVTFPPFYLLPAGFAPSTTPATRGATFAWFGFALLPHAAVGDILHYVRTITALPRCGLRYHYRSRSPTRLTDGLTLICYGSPRAGAFSPPSLRGCTTFPHLAYPPHYRLFPFFLRAYFVSHAYDVLPVTVTRSQRFWFRDGSDFSLFVSTAHTCNTTRVFCAFVGLFTRTDVLPRFVATTLPAVYLTLLPALHTRYGLRLNRSLFPERWLGSNDILFTRYSMGSGWVPPSPTAHTTPSSTCSFPTFLDVTGPGMVTLRFIYLRFGFVGDRGSVHHPFAGSLERVRLPYHVSHLDGDRTSRSCHVWFTDILPLPRCSPYV